MKNDQNLAQSMTDSVEFDMADLHSKYTYQLLQIFSFTKQE